MVGACLTTGGVVCACNLIHVLIYRTLLLRVLVIQIVFYVSVARQARIVINNTATYEAEQWVSIIDGSFVWINYYTKKLLNHKFSIRK